MLFAAACTLGNGTSPTANNTPVPPSPSLLPASGSAAAASPSAQPTASAPAANGLAVTSIPTHNGEVGVIYLAVTLAAGGGTPPYTWSGSGMPAGLSVSPQGVVTGNNTTAGKFSFTVTVTDSTGATATGTKSMTVFPALTVTQPCAQVCFVGMGCTVCGRFGTVSGGAGPYHYKQAGGVVPSGMTLNGFALEGPFPLPQAALGCVCDVLVAGPPITKIPWNLSASVTDDFGVTKTVLANFSEFFPVRILCSGATPCNCTGTNVCNSVATYQFGAPSDNVSVQVLQVCDLATGLTCVAGTSSLPAGWVATAKAGAINVTWDPSVSFTNQVTIDLVDHGACVAPQFAVSAQQTVSINYAP